jgi:hypothetical protein
MKHDFKIAVKNSQKSCCRKGWYIFIHLKEIYQAIIIIRRIM